MRTTLKDFLERAKKAHDNRYNYSKVKYETTEKKVIIICPEHGEFPMRPRAHYTDLRGCPKCSDNKKSGFSYNSRWANIEKTLYFIEITGNNECFLKIGVTDEDDLYERFQKGQLPYQYKSLFEVRTKEASKFETELKKLFQRYSYTPNLSFRGDTECFNIKLKFQILHKFKKIHRAAL